MLIVLGLTALGGLGGFVLWQAAAVPLLLFAGVLLAIFIDAPSRWLAEHTRLPRSWATGLVLILLVGSIVAVGFGAGGRIGAQVEELARRLPESADQLRAQVRQTSWGQALLRNIPDSASLAPVAGKAIGRVGGAFAAITWAVSGAVIVLFIGLFVAFQPELYIAGAVRLIPPSRRQRARDVLRAIGKTLRWWIAGRLMIMAIDGVAIAIGLWLLGVPLAMTLGLLAAVLAFIPNLGPILSFIPAALMALLQGPMMVVWVGLLYLGVQTVESYLVAPLIDKETVSLPPALILAVQVLMGVLAGVLGLLVATPLLVVIVVLIQMLYIQDVLKEPVKVLGEDHG